VQIKNLQVGNSGLVAGIDLVAFWRFASKVWRRNRVGLPPADFRALNLDQRRVRRVVRESVKLGPCLSASFRIGEAFVDLVFVTGIAA